MTDCKPISTPFEAKKKVSLTDTSLEDPSYFKWLVSLLQYLTLTRPDLSFNYASQFMHALNTTLLKIVRQIL